MSYEHKFHLEADCQDGVTKAKLMEVFKPLAAYFGVKDMFSLGFRNGTIEAEIEEEGGFATSVMVSTDGNASDDFEDLVRDVVSRISPLVHATRVTLSDLDDPNVEAATTVYWVGPEAEVRAARGKEALEAFKTELREAGVNFDEQALLNAIETSHSEDGQKLFPYTVTGVWFDTMEPFTHWVRAINHEHAADLALQELSEGDDDPAACVITGVFAGEHKALDAKRQEAASRPGRPSSRG